MKRYKVLGMIVFLVVAYGTPVHAMATYWSLFNLEGESTASARYNTYAMLTGHADGYQPHGLICPGQHGVWAEYCGQRGNHYGRTRP